MPLYNYECSCGREFQEWASIEERKNVRCECGKVAKQTICAPRVHKFDVQLGEFEHITKDTVYAGSKQELKDLCKKHECYAPGILD